MDIGHRGSLPPFSGHRSTGLFFTQRRRCGEFGASFLRTLRGAALTTNLERMLGALETEDLRLEVRDALGLNCVSGERRAQRRVLRLRAGSRKHARAGARVTTESAFDRDRARHKHDHHHMCEFSLGFTGMRVRQSAYPSAMLSF